MGNWLALLNRHSCAPIGWDEIVTGHDFGLLKSEEIQDWARSQNPGGPAGLRLSSLQGPELIRFEESLWAACAEAIGKVPRPGGRRWAMAQDRWRAALLADAMEAPLTAEALAVAVENIYEHVGCPEDMLGLWTRAHAWEPGVPVADRDAIAAFLEKLDPRRSPMASVA